MAAAEYLIEEANRHLAGLYMAGKIPFPGGKRIWVGSGVAGNKDDADVGRDPREPLATWDYARQQTSGANKGEVIILLPGHAETLASAGACTLSVAGVTTLGLGYGASRPTITFNTLTGASVNVSAASNVLANILFVNTINNATGPIDVDAAYCALLGCEFQSDGADLTLDWIVADANADDLLIEDCIHKGSSAAGEQSFLNLGAASDVRVINLKSRADLAQANIELTAAALNMLIERCKLRNTNTTSNKVIIGNAAGSGELVDNRYRIHTNTILAGCVNTPGLFAQHECYVVNADGEAGALVGTVSTT